MGKVRVLALADTHCGHVVGLTPPEWWQKRTGNTMESFLKGCGFSFSGTLDIVEDEDERD